MRKAIMALEGLEEAVDTPEVEAPEVTEARVEEIEQSPEQELQGMHVDETEINETNDSIEEADDTAEALADIQEKMGETIEEGGMDEKSAEVVQVAVEHLCKRIGFSSKRAGFSMEGFKDKESRVQATKVAMEELGEKIKKIYDTIVEAIKKIIESVKTFFSNLFNVAKKNKARAETLLSASKNAKESEDKLVKVNDILQINGDFISPANLANELVRNHKAIESELLAHIGSGPKLKELSRKSLELAKKFLLTKEEGKLEDDFKEIGDSIFEGWGKKTEEGDKITIVSNTTFIGDKQFKVETSTKFYKPNFFGFVDANKKEPRDVSLRALTPEQAGNVSSEVIKIMSDFLMYEKQIKEINDVSFSFTDGFKATFNAKPDATANIISVIQATTSIIRMVNITATKVRSYEMSVAGAALDYVAKSIKGSDNVKVIKGEETEVPLDNVKPA
jgi:hypothetical protein